MRESGKLPFKSSLSQIWCLVLLLLVYCAAAQCAPFPFHSIVSFLWGGKTGADVRAPRGQKNGGGVRSQQRERKKLSVSLVKVALL